MIWRAVQHVWASTKLRCDELVVWCKWMVNIQRVKISAARRREWW